MEVFLSIPNLDVKKFLETKYMRKALEQHKPIRYKLKLPDIWVSVYVNIFCAFFAVERFHKNEAK